MRVYSIYILSLTIAAICLCAGCAPACPDNCSIDTVEYSAPDGESLVIDIYSPKDAGAESSAPIIIYFHGGTWVSGSRHKIMQRYRKGVVEALVDSGCVVASVEYRLVDFLGNTIEQSLGDCRAALHYVRAHGSEFRNQDGRRSIVLWGSSSGAHLAMMTACGDTLTSSAKVSCIIDDFGPTNLTTALDVLPQWAKIKISDFFFGQPAQDIREFDSLARIYSPIYHISKKTPVMIFHGSNDDIVMPEQSLQLSDSLGSGLCDMLIFDGNGHGLHSLSPEQARLYITRLWDFLQVHLGNADAK